MKRSVAILSSAVLVVALMTGCGKAEENAQQNQNPSSQTDGNKQGNQATDANDPLTQFPKLTLPYTADAKAVVVEYQGGTITGQEFEEFLRVINFMNPQQGTMIEAADNQALKAFAREYTATKILASRSDDAMKKEAKDLADKTFEKIKGQYMGFLGKDEAKFTKLMEGQGVTKEMVTNQMALINESITVLKKNISDNTLKQEFDKMDKASRTVASVRHILISTEQRKPEEALKIANDLEARLKKGEDFAKLAKEFTDDPGSKENGGLYADADVSQWVPEFKDAAITQKVGEVGPPVKTSFGYHIIKVENRKEKTFDEMKEQLRAGALESGYDAFGKNELDKLITKYNVPASKNEAAPK
ncbi:MULTISPECIES: peptidylprolyl isomerase [Brevibacillus]|jgi:parvulin-like peptidyl-prolyl isomerase|uniref:PpiC domain-containing protein n=1 Tax=Brevibacillus parabrevis TaxID=54914 RepID=A0A4Y3PMF1_BREPA|nr:MULTISPECIES: peptidylprolyl isomerase [Brevibacillus]MBU8716035.1 peptidylprolyl isomerase [Brevibacillus parabrevis]MDH6353036.1 parvulin-like peptidyl-prolyl isomerase [Brevibacillus sp. 1238]MDR5002613.1 peptidylprolyl isomerase [Brevibacillus parabrevis]MED2256925.1 peptidylprolyl isomerase [Brevibacillus parabrevis]NRQ56595.1 peptidylprolyl isomerase [Brevibacillus sp. HD1.4A]